MDLTSQKGRHSSSTIKDITKLLRPVYWLKNLLVLIPSLSLVPSQIDVAGLFVVFLGFCFASSTVYIVNDYVDAEEDREHPLKRNRPFADGRIALKDVFPVLLAQLFGIFCVGFWVPDVGLVLLSYLLFSFLYCHQVRKMYLLDLVLICFLHLHRPLAGIAFLGLINFETLLLVTLVCTATLAFTIAKRISDVHTDSSKSTRPYKMQNESLLRVIGRISSVATLIVCMLYLYLFNNLVAVLTICSLGFLLLHTNKNVRQDVNTTDYLSSVVLNYQAIYCLFGVNIVGTIAWCLVK